MRGIEKKKTFEDKSEGDAKPGMQKRCRPIMISIYPSFLLKHVFWDSKLHRRFRRPSVCDHTLQFQALCVRLIDVGFATPLPLKATRDVFAKSKRRNA